MFEHKTDKILSRRKFMGRMASALGFATIILVLALTIGTLGYRFAAGFSWIDAFLNASMILTGMGPVGELKTVCGKLFASFFALFSGVVFLTIMAVTLGPVLHRLMHRFHIDSEGLKRREEPRKLSEQNRAE